MFCEWMQGFEKKQEVCRQSPRLLDSSLLRRASHLLEIMGVGLSERLEKPKDLNYSFRGREDRAKDKQKKLWTQPVSKLEKKQKEVRNTMRRTVINYLMSSIKNQLKYGRAHF